MDPVADHEARERGHQLASLRFHWGDAYEITWQDGAFQAVRRDGGPPLRAASHTGLSELLMEDYLARPVPPSAQHPSWRDG
jgi:hypothetical protein